MKRPRRKKEEGQGEKETEKKTSFSSFDMKKKKKSHISKAREPPVGSTNETKILTPGDILEQECVCAHVKRGSACVCVI